MHDASYSEVAFDGYRPISFLETPGAIDVGVEFHSLSKSYNMTGWRLGMAVGNEDIISALMVIKSKPRTPAFPTPSSTWEWRRWNCPQNAIDERNAIYEHRRDRVVQTLRDIGLGRHPAQGKPVCLDAHTGRVHIGGVHGRLLLGRGRTSSSRPATATGSTVRVTSGCPLRLTTRRWKRDWRGFRSGGFRRRADGS